MADKVRSFLSNPAAVAVAGVSALFCLSAHAVTTQDRINAANTAAATCEDHNGNQLDFYWEVGDQNGSIVTGSGGSAPNPATSMKIASAGKWLYGAYVAQERNGSLNATTDVPYLHMKMGYNSMSPDNCLFLDTVNTCFTRGSNDTQQSDDATVGSGTGSNNPGSFFYSAGQLQAHAVNDPALKTIGPNVLASTIAGELGISGLDYGTPSLGGGAKISPNNYTAFLRKILSNTLKIHDLLGANATCASLQPAYCDQSSVPTDLSTSKVSTFNAGTTANPQYAVPDLSELPSTYQNWKYSIAHWVEPDGSFSSPGALGFYPWIDSGKQWYGVVVQRIPLIPTAATYQDSVVCGVAIRKAWLNPP